MIPSLILYWVEVVIWQYLLYEMSFNTEINRVLQYLLISIDMQGTFHAIPHSVSFDKCIDILPDVCYRF